MTTFKGLPIYSLEFDENFIPTMALALVDFPAIEVNWQAFGKDSKRVLLKTVDEDKRIILGAAMIPDLPIYRNDGYQEYYITFSAETIAQVAAGFAENRHFNVMHDAARPAKCTLLESYILSAAEGKTAPAGFDLPDGTWIVKAHVDDEALWRDIKAGYFSGFSIESFFNPNYETIMHKHNHFRRAAQRIMCSSVTAIDANGRELVLTFVEDELADGIAVYVVDENGVMTPAADGEYKIGEIAYTVTDGIITRKAEEEIKVETEETVIVDAPGTKPDPDERYRKMEDRLRDTDERLRDMEDKFNEMAKRFDEMAEFIDTLKKVEVEPVETVTLRKLSARGENPALKFFRK